MAALSLTQISPKLECTVLEILTPPVVTNGVVIAVHIYAGHELTIASDCLMCMAQQLPQVKQTVQ